MCFNLNQIPILKTILLVLDFVKAKATCSCLVRGHQFGYCGLLMGCQQSQRDRGAASRNERRKPLEHPLTLKNAHVGAL